MKNWLFTLAFTCTFAFSAIAQTNYSLSFNGNTDYVTIGTPIATNGSYTKEAWIYLTNSAGNNNIISSSSTPFWISGGVLKAGQAGSFSLVTDPNSYPLNTWGHVAVTYDAPSQTMNLYRNGLLISTATSVPAYTAETTTIGCHHDGISCFSGKIDEVRIWNTALTPAQLRATMLSGPAANATGLVDYYKFNDGSGNTLTNSCTNSGGSNGTISGSLTWVSSPVNTAATAINQSGSTNYVQLANRINVATNDFSFEIMVNPTDASANYIIWATDQNGDGNSQFRASVLTNSSAELVLSNQGNSNILHITTPANLVPVGSWTQIAIVRSGLNGYIYINGVLQASGSTATVIDNEAGATSTKCFRIGARGNLTDAAQGPFSGSFDEFRYWNTAIAQSQIQSNMGREINPGTQSNLIAYYTFNQGIPSGTNTGLITVADQKGTNDASLNNFALTGTSSNFIQQPSSLTPLPISYTSFTVQKQDQGVLLKWTTAEEKNTRDFTVQYSSDTRSWTTLTTLKAAGNSNTPTSYSFLHTNPQTGMNYYRLLETDLDGISSLSEVKSITFTAGLLSVELLNNPAIGGNLLLRVNTATTLSFFAGDGKLLFRKQMTEGIQSVDVSRYAKGIYFIKTKDYTGKILID